MTSHIRPIQILAVLCIVALTCYSLTITLPEQAERYRGWNGVQRDDLQAVESSELENALVFVPRPNWQFYAPFFLENSTTLDGSVIYAVDRGDRRNQVLMRDYPDRRFYRYQDGELRPLGDASSAENSQPPLHGS